MKHAFNKIAMTGLVLVAGAIYASEAQAGCAQGGYEYVANSAETSFILKDKSGSEIFSVRYDSSSPQLVTPDTALRIKGEFCQSGELPKFVELLTDPESQEGTRRFFCKVATGQAYLKLENPNLKKDRMIVIFSTEPAFERKGVFDRLTAMQALDQFCMTGIFPREREILLTPDS